MAAVDPWPTFESWGHDASCHDDKTRTQMSARLVMMTRRVKSNDCIFFSFFFPAATEYNGVKKSAFFFQAARLQPHHNSFVSALFRVDFLSLVCSRFIDNGGLCVALPRCCALFLFLWGIHFHA